MYLEKCLLFVWSVQIISVLHVDNQSKFQMLTPYWCTTNEHQHGGSILASKYAKNISISILTLGQHTHVKLIFYNIIIIITIIIVYLNSADFIAMSKSASQVPKN